jgi:putative ABC transport system substrate-binding protein
MRRREFLWLFGCGVAATWPSSVGAQQAAKVYRIAIVTASVSIAEALERRYRDFLDELRRLGYVEGQNLTVERFYGDGRFENYREMVGTVVRSKPHIVLAGTLNLIRELQAQTTTVPIVAVIVDPIDLDIVPNVARPGGNVTGVYVGLELWGKRLGLLKEAIPKLTRVGLLVADTALGRRAVAMLKEVSEKAGISLVGSLLESPFDEVACRRAFAVMVQEGAEAVYVGDQAEPVANVRLIVELAQQHRLPAIYPYRDFVEAGGLMAYEYDTPGQYVHAADAAFDNPEM